MENFIVCFNAVLPMFLMIALGYAARLCKLIDRDTVMRINPSVFYFFLPLLLFYNLYNTSIKDVAHPKFILFAAIGIAVFYFLSTAFVLKIEKSPAKRGVMIQGLFRSNYNIMGIPFVTALIGRETSGLAAILLPAVVPVFNILGVVSLQSNQETAMDIRKVILDILRHPFIIASAVGVFFMVTGFRFPPVIERALRGMAAAATPIQLFLVGAFFSFGGLEKYAKELTIVTAGRLAVIPAIAMAAAISMGFRGEQLLCLLGVFATPCAVASFPMAAQMGGDSELAGDTVVTTSALVSLTLFLWAFFLKTLGMF